MRRLVFVAFIGMVVSVIIQSITYICCCKEVVLDTCHMRVLFHSLQMLPVLSWSVLSLWLYLIFRGRTPNARNANGGDVRDVVGEDSRRIFRRVIVKLLMIQYLVPAILIAIPFLCERTKSIHIGGEVTYRTVCLFSGVCIFVVVELLTLIPLTRRFKELRYPSWLPAVLMLLTAFSKIGFIVQLVFVIAGLIRKTSPMEFNQRRREEA